MYVERHPNPSAHRYIPLFYLIAFIMPVLRSIKMIVTEKEAGLKQLMSIMGVSDLTNSFAW
jgi:hypothetical protein